MSRTKQGAVFPLGYLAEGWLGVNEDTPAVVVNPDATAVDLLAWVCGEVRSLDATARALVGRTVGDSTIDVCDFEAMFVHRIAPMERVLDLALCQLLDRRDAERAKAAQACADACDAVTMGRA